MPTITVDVPDALHRFIDQRVTEGGFPDSAAYLLSLIGADQRFHAQELQRLKTQVEEGLRQLDRGEYFEYESSEQLLDDIIRRGEERMARTRPKSA